MIFPTVLREVYQESIFSEDTFDTLEEAEKYLEKNFIKEYGATYTILPETILTEQERKELRSSPSLWF